MQRLGKALLEDRVSAILRAHRHGANLAVFGRVEAQWLLDELRLICRDRSELIRLQQQVTQTGDLARRASVYVQVVAPGGIVGASEGRKAIQLPIDHPAFDELLRKPLFIVEDSSTDLPVFEFILRNGPSDRVHVSFEGIHGGGSRIWDVADLRAADNRIILLVADSDRDAAVSSHAKSEKAGRTAESFAWPFFFWALTPCAETENIFGLGVLGALPRVAGSPSFQTLLSIFSAERKMGLATKDAFEWHFDLKEGLPASKFDAIADVRVKNWIEGKLALAGLKPPIADLPGFGGRLVLDIWGTQKCLAEFRATVRSARWQEMFGEFVNRIVWIFASSKQQRT